MRTKIGHSADKCCFFNRKKIDSFQTRKEVSSLLQEAYKMSENSIKKPLTYQKIVFFQSSEMF